MLKINIIIILISFFVFACSEHSHTGYLTHDVKIVNDSGAEAAELYFGNYVENGKVKVWLDKENSMLLSKPRDGLPLGKVTDKSVLDVFYERDERFSKVELVTQLEKNDITSDLETALKESEKVYYDNCSSCHAAPILEKYYESRLNAVLRSMISHANISPEEAKMVRRYVSIMLDQ